MLHRCCFWEWSLPPRQLIGQSMTSQTIRRGPTEASCFFSWLFIVPSVAYILTRDLLFVLLNALMFVPLYSEMDARKAWGWGAAGTMMCLASAWSGLVELHTAAIMLGFYILPWLIMGEEEMEQKPWLTRRFLMRTTLWAPVVLTSLYIILTLIILISSIDAVQFNAHEFYGAPFVMGMALALFAYTSRKQSPKQIVIGRSWYCTLHRFCLQQSFHLHLEAMPVSPFRISFHVEPSHGLSFHRS